MQYDFDKKESLAKAEQEKINALAFEELAKQKLLRNSFLAGFSIVFLFALIFLTQRNYIKRAKLRSDELLLNILPGEVVDELKLKGTTLARQFDNVTVVSTDFKGFTRMTENLSPAELIAELDECFGAFDDIITRHNMEKIKTIGDSYMAVGGLPLTNSTHPSDVVKAGLEIRQFIEDRRQNQTGKKSNIEVRIGIHTGPVIAGIIGTKKFAYDIWGDTVNIASRMESAGDPGKVNISESTFSHIKETFLCTHRGKIDAKNKGFIDMYFVESGTMV